MLLCFQLTRNVRFNWNMDNFKFNFLSWGQLESLNLDKIFLPLFKIFNTMLRGFLPILLECYAEIILTLCSCGSGFLYSVWLLLYFVEVFCFVLFVFFFLNQSSKPASVCKETVVMCQWESKTWKFGFIKRVGKSLASEQMFTSSKSFMVVIRLLSTCLMKPNFQLLYALVSFT